MNKEKLRVTQAIVVEGRDDVNAVSQACDALIIPTHGHGITQETWGVIRKAYLEKGIIILTDPDLAGERIRKRLTEQFPKAIQCFMTQEDTTCRDDIGIENARPEAIAQAIRKAIELDNRHLQIAQDYHEVNMEDLLRLGLVGEEGSSSRRAAVCKKLGIGYGNAKTMIRKLSGFQIGVEELEEACLECK